MSIPNACKLPALLLPLLSLGCAPLLQNMPQSVAVAALNQNDPDIVRDGLPAYMLMLDGMIAQQPDDSGLLMAGAKLYAFYASALVDAPARAQHLTETARTYAARALCLKQSRLCDLAARPFDAYAAALKDIDRSTLPQLYTYGLAWGAWLQSRSQDWQALADRPKIEALFERTLALDETYDDGRGHYYLAMLRSQLPSNLGGNPENAKMHFERAIALSHDQDLAVKVQFAKLYARLVFDRTLHDRLLREVLQADPNAPGLTLGNVLAQREARRLLDESPNYFQE